jgi:hypothetical protein
VEWGPSGVGKEKLEGLAKDGVVQSDVKGVSVPLFNIVDSGSTTQEIISKAVSTFFGIKHDYYGGVVRAPPVPLLSRSLSNQAQHLALGFAFQTALFAKLAMKQDQFKDMVDDANEVWPFLDSPAILVFPASLFLFFPPRNPPSSSFKADPSSLPSLPSSLPPLRRCTSKPGPKCSPFPHRRSKTPLSRLTSTNTSSKRYALPLFSHSTSLCRPVE